MDNLNELNNLTHNYRKELERIEKLFKSHKTQNQPTVRGKPRRSRASFDSRRYDE